MLPSQRDVELRVFVTPIGEQSEDPAEAKALYDRVKAVLDLAVPRIYLEVLKEAHEVMKSRTVR